jgi:hypothetical protein
MINAFALAGTVILKLPSGPVAMPRLDPLIVIEADAMGEPVASVTVPVITRSCA